ncbi:MAG: phosphatase PAP2 family protein [Candidatus Paceibacterota bacterium]
MLSELHTQLFYILNSFSGLYPILDSVLFSLANGTGVVLFLLITLWVLVREKNWKRSALLLAHIVIPVCIAIIYTEVLKNLFQAPRPWVSLSDVRVLFEYGGFDSFPSGHATAYGALALSTYFYSRHLGLYIGLVALCISLSRIIVGIHWPLDIIAGFAIGFSIAYTYYHYVRRRVSFCE